MQRNPRSIPSFDSFVNNVEAAWLSVPPLHPHQHPHKRVQVRESLPLSASSSASTEPAGPASPTSTATEDEAPTFSSIRLQRPSPPSQSRRDYWNIVMGPRQPKQYQHHKTSNKSKSIIRKSSKALKSSIATPVDSEKRFACPSCPLRFRKRCNLMTHISNVHEKIRPFYCSLCLRRFARKSNCAKHMRLVHHLSHDRIQVRKVQQE